MIHGFFGGVSPPAGRYGAMAGRRRQCSSSTASNGSPTNCNDQLPLPVGVPRGRPRRPGGDRSPFHGVTERRTRARRSPLLSPSVSRTVAGPSPLINSWPMPSAAGSTSWCAGGWIASAAAYELQSLGVAIVSLAEGIDATTPAGRSRCTSQGDRRIRARTQSREGAGEPTAG
jgi:hypothetical protein